MTVKMLKQTGEETKESKRNNLQQKGGTDIQTSVPFEAPTTIKLQ